MTTTKTRATHSAPRTTKQVRPDRETGDAYMEGANAYLAGTPKSANPYPSGSDHAADWELGWDCEDGDDDIGFDA